MNTPLENLQALLAVLRDQSDDLSRQVTMAFFAQVSDPTLDPTDEYESVVTTLGLIGRELSDFADGWDKDNNAG